MSAHFPMPELDRDSKIYWEGAKNHKLLIQQCNTCKKHIFYPRIICPHCFSDDLAWVEASGKGHIYSYTVVHHAMPPFKDQAPYVIAIIDLEEGVRMLSRIVGDRSEVAIGKPVSVVFEKVNDDLTLPCFKVV